MLCNHGDTCTSIAMQHIYCECCASTETHALALQCNTYIVNVVQSRNMLHKLELYFASVGHSALLSLTFDFSFTMDVPPSFLLISETHSRSSVNIFDMVYLCPQVETTQREFSLVCFLYYYQFNFKPFGCQEGIGQGLEVLCRKYISMLSSHHSKLCASRLAPSEEETNK